jgi:L-aminoadipate-semialdehyde dehydrogenase
MSQHPLVRENVTLVRRDKDEEKILVSYFVPLGGSSLDELASDLASDDERGLAGGIRKYRRLIKDIRELLKKKLPSYSVPSRELLVCAGYGILRFRSLRSIETDALESKWKNR